jgi:hypothetical protein
MLKRHFLSLGLAVAALSAAAPACAETLLIDRVQQERNVPLPARGMTMAQVEQQFGAPADRLDPRGGDAPLHPVINRWKYDRFTVYFEKDLVINAVVNRASPTELGPKRVETSNQ